MIVQWIIDFLRDLVVAWIRGWPQPPLAFWDLRTWLLTTGHQLGDTVSLFGALIPFNAFNSMIATWVSIMAFWLVIAGIRVVLWALNR